MKYNININQLVLSKTQLDLTDCAILDYLYIYCNSQNSKIEKQRIRKDGEIWTWVNYQTLLTDMPLLKIKSSGALTPRIKRIEKEGYITTKRFTHQKLFIKLNSKIDELFIQMNRAIHENEQSYSFQRTNNNTIHNNTKINIVFNIFWDLYEKKNGLKSKVEKKWNSLTDKDRKDIIDYVPKYKEAQPDKQFRKHPMTFLNNESWKDELISNNKPKKRKVYFQGDPVYEKKGKQWVVSNGEWREFVGEQKDLEIKFE